jgi:ABC-type sugar transport system ATPase subunit
VKIHSPQAAICAGLALAPEDRKADGVVLGMSVCAQHHLFLPVEDRAPRVPQFES